MRNKYFWAAFLGDFATWRVNDISCQGQESFTNAFSNNLKTVYLKHFANHQRVYT